MIYVFKFCGRNNRHFAGGVTCFRVSGAFMRYIMRILVLALGLFRRRRQVKQVDLAARTKRAITYDLLDIMGRKINVK